MDSSDLTEVVRALGEQAINVSVSTADMTRLDMESRGIESLVRASVHYYNSNDEIARLLTALESLA